jgi:predicted metal-dependent hydrolase
MSPQRTDIKIKRQNRKSLMMKLTAKGIEVFIPHWLPKDDPQLLTFIESGMKKFENYAPPAPLEEQTSPDEILAMVETWAARMGVQPQRVRMRSMTSRWGSCSSKGSINLNRALCSVPRPLAEYVVCHELVHLRVLNHGKAFYDMMSQYMPDWKARRKELKRYRP